MATRTSRTTGFGRAPIPDFFGAGPVDLRPARPADPRPGLGPDVRDRIGQELRAMYTALAGEPVPERFAALLRRLGPAESANADAPKERR
ncbi:MAG TPA: NepR family anti-sigma factor [Beijerinckiaceae bacterium]|jgi:hypothetical protein